MGADTGVDTINKKQEGKNGGDSSVAFAGKLDTMGVLFLKREWLTLQTDSALAAMAVQKARGKAVQALAQNMLQMYPDRRRELEGIAYQLNVPLQAHTPVEMPDKITGMQAGNFDASFVSTVKARLQMADTSYQSAMKNDNHLLKDFASRLHRQSQQQLDTLKAFRNK